MKTTPLIIGLGALLMAGIFAIVTGLTVLSWHNTANGLHNQYEMKIKANSGEFDNMWKKIKQTSGVAENKKDAFKEIFTAYAGSRNNGSKDQMMTWVKESAPNLDLKVYDQVLNVITGSRDTWTMKQTELVSIAEQYNAMLVTVPKGTILKFFGHTMIDPKVITSSRTEEAFATGKDDDLSL